MGASTDALMRAFQRRFGRPATVISEAPGRVNLIGEHTDYNLGYVLPVAIDRTIAVAAAPSEEQRVRVYSLDYDECDEFSIDSIERLAQGGWRNYARAVAWALREAGHELRGADLAVSGDVPPGTGLASSAALEVALAGALAAVSEAGISERELALCALEAENRFVGVQCGIMDQFAAALGREGHALRIDCRSLQVKHIPLPVEERGMAIVVIDSRVPRGLEATPYNQRRQECARAAELLGVESLRDTNEEMLEGKRSTLPATLYRRARHVVSENARVLAAADALRGGDLAGLGDLMYESHRSLRDDFEVSVPELDLLVDLAREVDGVLGARLTGAGFGGCTVNLVRLDALDAFRTRVLEEYGRRTDLAGEIYVCRAVNGLRVSYV